jgi:SH3 domain-containing YSC84-like protein 1
MQRTLLSIMSSILVTGLVALLVAAAPTPARSKAMQNPGESIVPLDSAAQDIVNNAVKTVYELRSDDRFEKMLPDTTGVFIVPHFVEATAGIGGAGGQGVLLAHRNGKWSNPAFLSIASLSVGLQIGGEAGSLAILLLTDKALYDFTQANNLSLNVNAGLTIIGHSAGGQAPVGKDFVVWTNVRGAFIGVNVSGTEITSNTAEDRSYYGGPVSTPEIIEGKVANPQADALRNALP